MIGRIRGILIERRLPGVTVEVQGLGYELEVSVTTFTRLPETGTEVELFVHTLIRQDAWQLYGFASPSERGFFRNLIRVNGVGPKVALAILSGMTAGDLARCIMQQDIAALIKVPGIGKRTAERLLVEMRDRVDLTEAVQQEAETGALASRNQILKDAESALVALGFKPQEAARALAEVDDELLPVELLVKAALRNLA